ncbi:MAG: hypothetical protein WD645_01045 [Dehalococcoidia bacterium]
MPKFEVLPINEAQANSATGKRAQILREYMGYIEQVPLGQAGRLQAGPGETISAVRRRLGAAAKALGKSLIIRRTNDQVYFWIEGQDGRKRRGRRPKNQAA